MFQTTLVNEHGIFFNYKIPERIGSFKAYSQITDSRFTVHQEYLTISSYDPNRHGDYVEEFGLSESQENAIFLANDIVPQYIIEFDEAYLKGSDYLTPNQTSFVLSFTTCGDYQERECASEEEIYNYFATHLIKVNVL